MISSTHTAASTRRGRWCLLVLAAVWSLGLQAQQIDPNRDLAAELVVETIVVAGHGALEDENPVLPTLTRLANQKLARFPERRVSLDQLHQLADELTLYLRQRGHSFDSVYLPPQKLSHNSLRFTYIAATLSDIHLLNESKIPDAALLAPLAPLQQQALYAQAIENAIHALQKQQRLRVFAFYSRGEEDGRIVLNLKAQDKKAPHFSATLENYGAEATGRYRALGDIKAYGLLGSFDELTLSLLRSAGEGGNTYGHLHYRRPFAGLNSALNLAVGDNQYQVGEGFEQINLGGSSRSWRASWSHTSRHFPQHSAEWALGLWQRQSRLDSDFGADFSSEEKSAGLTLESQRQLRSRQGRWSLGGGATAQVGRYDSANSLDTLSDEKLRKLDYHLAAELNFADRRLYASSTRLYLRGQHSFGASLPAIEAIALGGAWGVRGFSPDSYSAHSAALASLEWQWPQFFSKLIPYESLRLAPFVFFDAAQGHRYVHDDPAATSEIRLAAYGAGLQFSWQRLSGKLTYAEPHTHQHKYHQSNRAGIVSDPCAASSTHSSSEVCDAQILFQLRWQ